MKYYDVAVISPAGWFHVICNVLALSEIDAMNITKIRYKVIEKDAVI